MNALVVALAIAAGWTISGCGQTCVAGNDGEPLGFVAVTSPCTMHPTTTCAGGVSCKGSACYVYPSRENETCTLSVDFDDGQRWEATLELSTPQGGGCAPGTALVNGQTVRGYISIGTPPGCLDAGAPADAALE